MTKEEAISAETREALIAFAAQGTAPDERRAALSALSASKFLPKGAEDAAIAAGRQILLEQAGTAEDETSRLLAIAECMRLAQIVRRWQPQMAHDLQPAFEQPLPNMQLLDNGDDRLNLARACTQADAPWLADYLAQSIAEEPTGEKARVEMVDALLQRSTTLAELIERLTQAFATLEIETQEPGDTMARRLARTMEALRAAVLDCELAAGAKLGDRLHRWLSRSLAASGKPRDDKAQLDLCTQTLQLIHDVVRTRMSVVTDPDIYRAVAYCRRLNGGGSWPSALNKPVERLVTDVTEALLLLGRQGQRDQALLQQLDVLCNNSKRASHVAKQLAENNPDLPEHVRDWLIQGRVVERSQASAAAVEAAAGSADQSIGLAMEAARTLRGLQASLKETLMTNLELYAPELAVATKELLASANRLVVHTEHAAALRGLDLYGVPGQEVEASAKFFDVAGGEPRQRMVVRKPAVVRRRADGSPGEVVVKGLVE